MTIKMDIFEESKRAESLKKHILLLKLIDTLENQPLFSDYPPSETLNPQRQWISKVGALLSKVSVMRQIDFRSSSTNISFKHLWAKKIGEIKGQISDAIEELKLDLELDGRNEIGSVYKAGETYNFFKDLKKIISEAKSSILVIDPYFNGQAFDDYLSSVAHKIEIKILCTKYADDLLIHTKKFSQQTTSKIDVKKSKELHDRVVIIDESDCWIVGGSLKDAGAKTTYLLPLQPDLAEAKKKIYEDIWNNIK